MPTNAKATSEMVSYAGQPKATWQEKEYMERVKYLPCCVCLPGEQSMPTECHHITDGSRRLGHFYCLPLCRKHHVNVHLLTKQETQTLWERVNETLGIEREWPVTKLVSRAL